MKKICIGLFIILFHVSGYSQEANSNQNPNQSSQVQTVKSDTIIGRKYSRENLQQTSTEELNLYLKNARGIKTTGIVMTIAGPALVAVGVGMALGWYEEYTYYFYTGIAVTAVGIPVLVSGSRRVSKVKYAIAAQNRASLSIAPGFVFANQNKIPYPGISLKLQF